MITIIDYEMGNLRSVEKAFEKLGYAARVSNNPEDLLTTDKIVLPGVGAFRIASITCAPVVLSSRCCSMSSPASRYSESVSVCRCSLTKAKSSDGIRV